MQKVIFSTSNFEQISFRSKVVSVIHQQDWYDYYSRLIFRYRGIRYIAARSATFAPCVYVNRCQFTNQNKTLITSVNDAGTFNSFGPCKLHGSVKLVCVDLFLMAMVTMD